MALKVGQLAPDFALKNQNGDFVRLSDYRFKRNVVLAFFPLAWTPI
jgi:mycoredoxin-dependent peroxiredoxin